MHTWDFLISCYLKREIFFIIFEVCNVLALRTPKFAEDLKQIVMANALFQLWKKGSFEKQVAKRVGTAYPTMNGQVSERFECEMDWIRKQQLQQGFMDMWNIVEFAHAIGATVGIAKRGLENSLVAYCLGLTSNNPAADGEVPEFPFAQSHYTQKFGISIDASHRTPLVLAANGKHGYRMDHNKLTMTLHGIDLEVHEIGSAVER